MENSNDIRNPLPFDRDFTRHFNASQGYLKLDMISESCEEISEIKPEYGLYPEVMQLKTWILMKRGEWDRALTLSQCLLNSNPDLLLPYLDGSYCLHELGKTVDARETLLNGPGELQDYPVYHYNLACYEACLGNITSAHNYLEEAISLNSVYLKEAKKDPDLKVLFI